MFSTPCGLCSAETSDVYRHMAWHVAEGHDVSEERVAMLDQAREVAVAEAQRRWEAARA